MDVILEVTGAFGFFFSMNVGVVVLEMLCLCCSIALNFGLIHTCNGFVPL